MPRRARLTTSLVLGLATLVGVGVFAAVVPSAAAASTLTNPSFDANGATQTPTGWSESGTTTASKSEAGGRSGGFQLAHWASSAYTVETLQTLSPLTAFRVW